ncbi:hypothetical protein FM114_02625 [Luteococcus japonicus LSP_Lj1]|uniref:Uncharacterized protein n=1 Tax=Luteococcus japonicus LSP_Lj1 TaxID=1255658 RepID=A0A1R4IM11_9ACTN|nr:hypothetical protein FM114_02625 [Luteococcus japonicus LSP_Lj1]
MAARPFARRLALTDHTGAVADNTWHNTALMGWRPWELGKLWCRACWMRCVAAATWRGGC